MKSFGLKYERLSAVNLPTCQWGQGSPRHIYLKRKETWIRKLCILSFFFVFLRRGQVITCTNIAVFIYGIVLSTFGRFTSKLKKKICLEICRSLKFGIIEILALQFFTDAYQLSLIFNAYNTTCKIPVTYTQCISLILLSFSGIQEPVRPQRPHPVTHGRKAFWVRILPDELCPCLPPQATQTHAHGGEALHVPDLWKGLLSRGQAQGPLAPARGRGQAQQNQKADLPPWGWHCWSWDRRQRGDS